MVENGNKINGSAEPPQMRECPFCGEKILAKAKKCRFCGEFLNGENPGSLPKTMGGRIKVDTADNFLNRNRGCGDLVLYGPLVFVVVVIVIMLRGGC